MTWWDFFNSVPVAASILGAILGLVAWINTRATNRLIADGRAQTQAFLREMDARAAERHRERP